MPYTSACGHLINTENQKLIGNPLEFWQHLCLNSDEEFFEALSKKDITKGEAEAIIKKYKKTGSVLKLSPTQLNDKINEYMKLHLYKIYHYLPKNDYYYKALEKYSDDDLNTERVIISSDFPTIQWFDEVELDEYLKSNLSDVNAKYKFDGKKILSLSPYINYKISEGIASFGASEVVSMASYYSGFELSAGKNIRRVNQGIEDLDNLSGEFDIIHGLDILEHVKDLPKFYENLKRLIKDDGIICLQGSPLWSSDNGHNCMLELDCGRLRTDEEEPCLAPWEHLAYDDKLDMRDALIKKGFTASDTIKISD